MERKKPNRMKKYLKKQAERGLVRIDFWVTAKSRDEFEQIVKATADEMPEPFSQKQREAKARTRLFDEITKEVRHEFFELKDKIQRLQAEIKALSPSFFKPTSKNTPVPEAIKSLPDTPNELKAYMTQLYTESQQAKKQVVEWKQRAKQYEDLYNAQYDENERLKNSRQSLNEDTNW